MLNMYVLVWLWTRGELMGGGSASAGLCCVVRWSELVDKGERGGLESSGLEDPWVSLWVFSVVKCTFSGVFAVVLTAKSLDLSLESEGAAGVTVLKSETWPSGSGSPFDSCSSCSSTPSLIVLPWVWFKLLNLAHSTSPCELIPPFCDADTVPGGKPELIVKKNRGRSQERKRRSSVTGNIK
jgi:hypothetical protein